MRVTIQRAALRRSVDAVRGAADPKAALKMLAHVLLVAEDGALYATATDLYRAAETGAACEVTTPGRVCLNVGELVARIGKLPEGPVELALDGSTVTLRASGKALRYSMLTPGADFPKLPFLDQESGPGPLLTMPAATLAALIGSVIATVSTDTTRPHVNAAFLQWTKTRLRMVATDGHRLARRDAANVATHEGDFLIPLSALAEVRRIVEGAEDGETITLSYVAPWAHLTIGAGLDALEFSFATPAAQFPPYEQVTGQTDNAVPCRMNRAAFTSAVSNVAVAAADRTGGVKLHFGPSCVRVSAESAESGSGFDEVPAIYAGPEITAGFNAKYLLDALAPLDTDEVELGVGTELDPLAVRAPGYLAVVMPMRI